jgi:hypothetical protein
METLHFTAHTFSNEVNEFDILVIFFSNDDHYLMVQRGPDDPQLVALGMNTYHIERDDQSYGNYGGVARARLHKQRLEFTLNADGQAHMACAGVIVDFQVAEPAYSALRESLSSIFQDAFEWVP